MKTIGVIGLGIMGHGMASNILAAGYPLIVWNRTKSKSHDLVERGAKLAGDVSELTREADVVISMLSADQQVLELLLGDGGVVHSARPGQIVIDSSTVSPQTSRRLSEAFAAKGVEVLDAPVTGSAPHAKEGSLGFMVGGKIEVFEQCVELFQVMGKNWVYLGPNGSGSTAKLASNSMVAISLLALAEGLTIVENAGIQVEDFLRVISKGGANSRVVETKAPKIVNNDMTMEFSANLMNKDLGLALEMSQNLGISTPALGLAKQLMQMTVGRGYGGQDVAAVFTLYREWAGKS